MEQSPKTKLMKLAAKKISQDTEFMSFHVLTYMEVAKKSEQSVRKLLGCSVEDYYQLLLCKAPDIDAENYATKLNEVSKYSNVHKGGLHILLSVVSEFFKGMSIKEQKDKEIEEKMNKPELQDFNDKLRKTIGFNPKDNS